MRDSFPGRFARGAALGLSRVVEPVARGLDWSARSLERQGLEAEARRETGLSDFGDPSYGEGLDRLLASLEEDAGLHFIGRLYVRRLVLQALRNRLLLEAWRKSAPAVRLNPPLVITGLPRSGTTLLHRLVGRQPGLHAPPYWQLARPLPNGPDDTDEARLAKAERELFWYKAAAPSMTSKHLITARVPEECIFALSLTFRTVLFWLVAPVEGYLRWYLEADLAPRYRDYRTILLALQSQSPEETLVLKAPDHLGGIAALLEAVPEARVAQLHRDPVAVVNSFNSLMLSAQNATSARRDVAERAAVNRDYLARELERNLADRRKLPGRVIDIRYDDLVADPVKTAASLLRAAGLRTGKPGRKRLERAVDRRPQGKHGRHVYSGADFGVDDAETRRRFQPYVDAFGLDP